MDITFTFNWDFKDVKARLQVIRFMQNGTSPVFVKCPCFETLWTNVSNFSSPIGILRWFIKFQIAIIFFSFCNKLFNFIVLFFTFLLYLSSRWFLSFLTYLYFISSFCLIFFILTYLSPYNFFSAFSFLLSYFPYSDKFCYSYNICFLIFYLILAFLSFKLIFFRHPFLFYFRKIIERLFCYKCSIINM